MHIRAAQPEEAEALTQIAFAAKGYWGYDQAQLNSWATELTYTPEYIRSHWVAVAEQEVEGQAQSIGVCSLEPVGDQLEIAGMWVSPDAVGGGVGRALLDAALNHCREKKVAVLRLLSDPNAQGFYEKMGACLIGQERGSPTGRLLPLMHFKVDRVDVD